MIKQILKSLPYAKRVQRSLSSRYERDDFVIGELKKISPGLVLLDAGCGSQRYRQHCSHLTYRAQDFAQFTQDQKKTITAYQESSSNYEYGALDYVGNVWDIKEDDESFDAILCTEVLEHVPFPGETIKEFGRLLRVGGKLILTAPSNCLRHMDPYFYFSGFSDRWYEKVLNDSGLRIGSITAVGDYYRWMAMEIYNTAYSHSVVSKLMLAPALAYYLSKRRTTESVHTLCMGYHVVAVKA